jgi:hypothetical protein
MADPPPDATDSGSNEEASDSTSPEVDARRSPFETPDTETVLGGLTGDGSGDSQT